ncbi:aspartic peptidase domain-containing protein [Mycena amicta]|nr:aspartic peptidase domain-containing protein [Mycena amicta]
MLLSFLLLLPVVSAVRVSVGRVSRPHVNKHNGISKVSVLAASSGDENALDLSTVHDLIYMANFTVGDYVYPVQLDTGSSDVWIKGSTSPLPNCTDTTLSYNLTYGIGWVAGHIAYGPVQFAGINVSSQALLDVSSANNPALAYGAEGLVGLGFTSLSSIDSAINKTGASTGRSLLYNLFQDNPSEPNFIAFSLQRSTDSSDTVQGTFSIGEVEPEYAAVLNTTAIPTWPVASPNRWNVLLEALLIGSDKTIIPNTTVTNAPSNRAVVLLDSGTSYTYAPTEICEAIYGSIPGAYLTDGQWVVPCSTEVDIALQFAGQVFPLHPLDVAPVSLSNSSLCVGSFVPQSVTVGAGEFDWLIGDNVLRSFYSVYAFGDFDSSNQLVNPYVKLLALVDPNQASKDFHAARGGTAATNITYNASNNTATTSSSVTVPSDISDTLNKIVTFIPAMLGIMALNAAVLIALIILGVVFMCRKQRKTKATTRKTRGRATPLQMDPRNSYVAGADPQPHTYEPVSMAVTEDMDGVRPMSVNPRDSFAAVPLMDRAPVSMAISEDDMFIPPSSTARPFKSSGLRPKDRPNSSAYQRQPSMAVSEDQLYAPPSPGFRNFDAKPGDRPMSAVYHRQPSEDSLVAPARSFDERPRSVGYQRSPSEEDSLFIASPTQMVNEPVFLPPPPQRQAPPPPPSRQAPQAPPQRAPPEPPADDVHPMSSSPEPIAPPQRRVSQNSMRLMDDQFAASPLPQPTHRDSTYSSRLVDDQFPVAQPRQMTPQPVRRDSVPVGLADDQFSPGTSSPGPIPRPRQASSNSSLFVPREFSGRPGDRPQSFAPADPSALVPPTPAFHSDGGGRPKSMAM